MSNPNELAGCHFGLCGHRFPAEVISQAVWLHFLLPLSLRMVEAILAAGGILSYETVRHWARKFGQEFASSIAEARNLPRRAIGQAGMVLDMLVQIRRDKRAARASCASC